MEMILKFFAEAPGDRVFGLAVVVIVLASIVIGGLTQVAKIAAGLLWTAYAAKKPDTEGAKAKRPLPSVEVQ